MHIVKLPNDAIFVSATQGALESWLSGPFGNDQFRSDSPNRCRTPAKSQIETSGSDTPLNCLSGRRMTGR
jgi:hypothetical protein